MDFSLDYTPEQEDFRREVVAWLEENLPKGLTAPADIAELSHAEWLLRRELCKKLGEKGWHAPGYPKEYGGGGLSASLGYVISQELGRLNLNPPYYDVGVTVAAPAILLLGTEDQKGRLLPPILRADLVTWQLFTEPEAGSDVANVQTKAVRDGDDFVINGHKIFVGAIHDVDQFWCLTNTDPAGQRHRNLSMFLVPAKAPGVTITPLSLIAAPFTGKKHTVSLDNVRVSVERLVGGLHNGWAVANSTLEIEHGGVRGPGMNPIVPAFLRFCRETPWVRQRIDADPVIGDLLAQLYIDAQAERLLSLRNFWLAGNQEKTTYELPQLSLMQKEYEMRIASAIQRIVGPLALTKDRSLAPLAGALEAQQRFSIISAPGGTIDIQKVIVARRLGIGRAAKEALD